jgi:hypothetical protein
MRYDTVIENKAIRAGDAIFTARTIKSTQLDGGTVQVEVSSCLIQYLQLILIVGMSYQRNLSSSRRR